MGLITFSPQTPIKSADVNTNFQTVYNDVSMAQNSVAGAVTTSSTSLVDVANASVVVGPTATASVQVMASGDWYGATAGNSLTLQLVRDTTLIGNQILLDVNANNTNTRGGFAIMAVDTSVPSGSHTYKLQAKSPGGISVTVENVTITTQMKQ